MKLQEIADKLNNDFNLPYQNIRITSNLCDAILIQIALQPQSEWKHGIFHNANRLIAHVFCSGQKEHDNSKYTFKFSVNNTKVKLMQKTTSVAGMDIYKHVYNQLNKIKSSL